MNMPNVFRIMIWRQICRFTLTAYRVFSKISRAAIKGSDLRV